MWFKTKVVCEMSVRFGDTPKVINVIKTSHNRLQIQRIMKDKVEKALWSSTYYIDPRIYPMENEACVNCENNR